MRCDAYGVGLQIINNKFTGPQPQFGAIQTGGTDILIEGNELGKSVASGPYFYKLNVTTKENRKIFAKTKRCFYCVDSVVVETVNL